MDIEAQREKSSSIEPAEDQEVQGAQIIIIIEALREVVDKVIQVHFDEAYTNEKTRYSRTEHMLYGCGYDNTKEIRKTVENRTVLFFGIRSLLTIFNVLISATAITSYNGAPDELARCLSIAEETGLEVKAVVCGRSKANLQTLANFVNGKYQRKRADGTMYLVTLATVANLDVAVKRKTIRETKEMRTYEAIAALTKLSTIINTGKISSDKWEDQKAVLAEVKTYLKDNLQASEVADATWHTIDNFMEVMDGLLEAFVSLPNMYAT
uniref:Transposable element P transposase-like RNase H domain-containing protein n=1 Tax=Glossina palpalis gambiensis TaxID=67801 RepID=A0A1B0C2A5_9MUSC